CSATTTWSSPPTPWPATTRPSTRRRCSSWRTASTWPPARTSVSTGRRDCGHAELPFSASTPHQGRLNRPLEGDAVAGKLAGKIAVVTGGARGIGGGIAAAFAAEGADMVIADVLGEDVAAPVLASIEQAGRRHLLVRTDVSDEQQVRAMVGTALAEFGRVDILVNDAGIVDQKPFTELEVSDWDRVISVNLRGVFLCTRFVLPGMLERGSGKVINIASQLGQIGGVEMVHYSASKAVVIGLTKALAR